MRALVGCCFLAASLVAFSGEASAWYCRAESGTGAYGWGQNNDMGTARRRALYECAVRTPRNSRCVIRYCQ